MSFEVLHNISFLESVGKESKEYHILTNWDDALAQLQSPHWEDATQNAQGDLTEWLTVHAPHRYQSNWNKRVGELRPLIKSLIDSSILPLIPQHSEIIKETLLWDLLLIAMDQEFSDLLKRPQFARSLLTCYQAGHLPCGIIQNEKLIAF